MERVRQSLDTWEVLPEGMTDYLKHYGRHFNRKMYEFAVSNMYKINRTNGAKEKLTPLTKEYYDQTLKRFNIHIDNDVMCDGLYVMSMAIADFLGKSLPNEQFLAMYVKDYVDDVDQVDGFIFNRFYADCVLSGTPIDWDEML